jgi:excisionase family DNA binding protein
MGIFSQQQSASELWKRVKLRELGGEKNKRPLFRADVLADVHDEHSEPMRRMNVTKLPSIPGATRQPLKPLSVTVSVALRVTGLGRTKFYQLLENGTIQSVTIGRRRLVNYASLERLASGDAVTPNSVYERKRPRVMPASQKI